ncbi:MAG: NlpC/P60 family protein [Sphingomonadales bacterium]|nr:NlpC/P60 family protein [Sphingomonadales bacterium]
MRRARAAVGIRFRLHGRGADGLDCVGLVALAWALPVPTGYRLRTGDAGVVACVATALGLQAVTAARAGDVLVFASAPGQLHLGIDTGGGLIHADAALRRVVERPGTAPWPLIARWRKGER